MPPRCNTACLLLSRAAVLVACPVRSGFLTDGLTFLAGGWNSIRNRLLGSGGTRHGVSAAGFVRQARSLFEGVHILSRSRYVRAADAAVAFSCGCSCGCSGAIASAVDQTSRKGPPQSGGLFFSPQAPRTNRVQPRRGAG